MKRINKLKPYIINALFVLIILLSIFLIDRTSPFGNNVLAKSDAVNIFKPMLFDFITKLKNGTLLNYSFNNGLGNPFTFNYIYHLISPLNLIALFFNSPDSMYMSTIILKVLVGSLITTYYVKSKTDNLFIIFISTISYIFSSWFLAYYYYLPWLDVFILFPLFQKGLEDLLNNNKKSLYIISLSLITIANFYLAFSIYIYTIVYFIISEFIYKKQNKKDKLKAFNNIALSTVAAFFILFLYVYILFDTYIKMSAPLNDDTLINYTVTIMDFLKSFIYGNTNVITEMEGNTFPNIATNYFILINTIYFFINKKIDKKDKKIALIVIILFLSTIFIKPIDLLLNMLHPVRGLTFRYMYIFTFLNIKLFINNIKTIEKEDYKKMLIAIPIILLPLLITWKENDKSIIVFTICSLLAYVIAFILYSDNKYHKALISLIVIVQSIFAGYTAIPLKIDKENINYHDYTKENVKYRVNISEGYDTELFNGNLYHNSKVTHVLSAMTYYRPIVLAEKLGCSTFSTTSMICDDENQMVDLLFNVKNPYYLEKIFAVNKEITLISPGFPTEVKTNTENIIEGMTGIKDIYEKETLIAEETSSNYKFTTDNNFYIIEIKTEEGMTGTVVQKYTSFTQEKQHGKNTAIIYTLKKDKLEEIYNYLKKNQIEYTSYNDNKIEGTIHVDKNQIIYTSIPYDISWDIKVDGQKVKPLILLDTFIGIEVAPGDHEISMEYKKKDYIGPAIISGISIIIFIIYNIKKKKA